MSYIGSKPADAVLETDDIADGVVTNPKLSTGSQQNFRNIIINGDMSIAQRGTSSSSVTDSGYYTIDRFKWNVSASDTVTLSQSTDVPTGQGFTNSYKVDVTTEDSSIGANEFAHIQHRIEAQNLQYLKYGTSSAETLTLSFWVKSTKTGTYCIALEKEDNTRYDYVAEYSISSASTWEKKTITIAPDSNIKAAGGAIDNNNGEGFNLKFVLATGSSRQGSNETWNTSTPADGTSNQVNFLDSTSNDFYLTGVQLEAGTTASDFEFLPYDVNLTRCYRYYRTIVPLNTDNRGFSPGFYTANDNGRFIFPLDNPMRAIPTLDSTSGTDYFRIFSAGGSDSINSFSIMSDNSTNRFIIANNTTEASGIGGQAAYVLSSNNNAYLALEAEL